MSDETKAKNNSTNLAKAKLALSGEEKLISWKKEGEDLEKRRQEAVRALASDEQKKAWAEEEKARQNKLDAQKKLAELEAERRLNEQEKRKNLSEEQIKRDQELEAERIAQIDKILESQKEIDRIKKDPKAGPAPIRTLTRDIGEVAQRGGLSASGIITNTPDKKSLAPSKKRGGQSWLIGIGLILILGGLGAVLWSVLQRQETSIAPLAETRQSIIFADEQISINLDETTAEQAKDNLGNKSLTPPESRERVQEIYFTYQEREQTPQGLVTRIEEANPTVFATKLELNLPDELLRFLEPKMMFGFYYGQKTTPFYIFKTKNYKNVADALINNENLIASELFAPLVGASTTEKILTNNFQDKMIDNYDTRLIIDEANTVIALYSWLSRDTLVFTTNESTFSKILNSFLSPKTLVQ
jgi:hypothetical protein